MKTLKDVKVGETATVKKLHGEGPVKRRIMDMGITKGVGLQVRKVAPLGDPMELNVRGYCAEGCPAGIPIPQVLELYNQALPAGAPTAGQAAAYAALPGAKAAQCVGCKKCETVCPQRLPVAARMRQTAALFGQTGA